MCQLKFAFQLRDSFWWLSFREEPIVGTFLLWSEEWKVGSDQLCLVIHPWFITLRGWFYKIRFKVEGCSYQMGPISHFIHCSLKWHRSPAHDFSPVSFPTTGLAFVTGLGTKEIENTADFKPVAQSFFILWPKCRLCFSVLGFHNCHAWFSTSPWPPQNPNHSL